MKAGINKVLPFIFPIPKIQWFHPQNMPVRTYLSSIRKALMYNYIDRIEEEGLLYLFSY